MTHRAKSSKSQRTGIGFRVKSGWAMAVLMSGPAEAPRVLDRRIVELSDPEFPETRQPYHGGTGREETDGRKISGRIKAVERVARQSIGELLEAYQGLGFTPRAATLVVGSLIAPDSIANPHIRAHALEGQLFRTVIAEALGGHGLRCDMLVERNAYSDAEGSLRRSEADLKRALTALGRDVGRPWGANEKLAAVAAWMSLA